MSRKDDPMVDSFSTYGLFPSSMLLVDDAPSAPTLLLDSPFKRSMDSRKFFFLAVVVVVVAVGLSCDEDANSRDE